MKARLIACLAFAASGVFAAGAPLKGIVLWPDQAEDHPELKDSISLEYSYCLPCDVATGTNAAGQVVYNWSSFEALLDGIASRGHQAVIRFRYVYPGEKLGGVKGATAVPKFIKETPGYKETYAQNPGGDGPTYYPDWSCKALEDFTLDFYAKFAAKYDSDSRLAFVQAGFGHWAEYHTSGTETQPGVNFPTLDFQRRFFRLMAASFVQTPWMVSIDSAAREEGYSPAVEMAGSGIAFGLFDDSFMCSEHEISSGEGYNELNWNAFGADHWKTAPHGGEISYYDDSDQHNFLSSNGIYGVTWAQAAAKYHMTFVIANDAPDGRYATPARVSEAARECGFNLVAASVHRTQSGVGVRVRNTGVAPVYHDIGVRVGDVAASGTLKGLLPGAERVLVAEGASADGALELVSQKLLSPVPLERVASGGARPMLIITMNESPSQYGSMP